VATNPPEQSDPIQEILDDIEKNQHFTSDPSSPITLDSSECSSLPTSLESLEAGPSPLTWGHVIDLDKAEPHSTEKEAAPVEKQEEPPKPPPRTKRDKKKKEKKEKKKQEKVKEKQEKHNYAVISYRKSDESIASSLEGSSSSRSEQLDSLAASTSEEVTSTTESNPQSLDVHQSIQTEHMEPIDEEAREAICLNDPPTESQQSIESPTVVDAVESVDSITIDQSPAPTTEESTSSLVLSKSSTPSSGSFLEAKQATLLKFTGIDRFRRARHKFIDLRPDDLTADGLVGKLFSEWQSPMTNFN